jgi:REP element-mobilizing transposase RayT
VNIILANYDAAKFGERLSRVQRFARRYDSVTRLSEKPRSQDHKGWYVPRALPHFDSPHTIQAITFRLGDALPRIALEAHSGEDGPAYRRRIAAVLDAGRGQCLLRDVSHATIVETALFHGIEDRYDLHAFVIMPNHVHVMIAAHPGNRLADIVQSWKSWSARAMNRCRGGIGSVWQRDYFDQYMRSERHASETIAYIEQNPVKAGLVTEAAHWRFGSAWWRTKDSRLEHASCTSWSSGAIAGTVGGLEAAPPIAHARGPRT